MEVTKDNFLQLLPLIKESIEAAQFITFDSEFSGKQSYVSIQRHLTIPYRFDCIIFRLAFRVRLY